MTAVHEWWPHLIALAASGVTMCVLYYWGRRSRDADVARLSAALACERELRQGTLLICRALETDKRHLQAAVRELTTHIRACRACRKRAARQRPVRPGPSPGGGPATPEETAGMVDYAERWLAKQRERRQSGGGQLV